MCSMDRIENTNSSQLEFFRELQLSVNLSSHPACVRLRDGTFTHFNASFASTFLCSVKFADWLNSIDIASALRLSALDVEIYSNEEIVLLEENITLNSQRWDFIIEKMAFMDNEFTLWKFCHVQRGPFFMPLYPSKTLSKVNDFKKAIRMFGEVKFETFALYCLGASHQVISEVLSIQESTSKRRVNRIYADLPVKSRDEVYYLIFASGVASQLFKVASEILSRRVTRLLNK